MTGDDRLTGASVYHPPAVIAPLLLSTLVVLYLSHRHIIGLPDRSIPGTLLQHTHHHRLCYRSRLAMFERFSAIDVLGMYFDDDPGRHFLRSSLAFTTRRPLFMNT